MTIDDLYLGCIAMKICQCYHDFSETYHGDITHNDEAIDALVDADAKAVAILRALIAPLEEAQERLQKLEDAGFDTEEALGE
jgi:5'-deoxynucleotidase YfbR-like HD superfamily hydrolase